MAKFDKDDKIINAEMVCPSLFFTISYGENNKWLVEDKEYKKFVSENLKNSSKRKRNCRNLF